MESGPITSWQINGETVADFIWGGRARDRWGNSGNSIRLYHTIALISYASKVMLKILQARLQQYVNRELLDVQAGHLLDKAETPEIKLPTSAGSWKKQESSRKISISALLIMPKPLTMWITINCGKFFKRWEYQTT